MTYREKLEEIAGKDAWCFNEHYSGGVFLCPSKAFENAMNSEQCYNLSWDCEKCWDMPYKGEKFKPEYLNEE